MALASLGWTTVSLLEGQTNWGGVAYPSNQGWAVFRVMIDLAAGQGVSIGAASTAVAAVNFFKPARAWLDSLWFAVPAITDTSPVPSDMDRFAPLLEGAIRRFPFLERSGVMLCRPLCSLPDAAYRL